MKPQVKTGTTVLVTPDESKRAVEAYLDAYFERRLTQAASMDPSYVRLWRTFEQLFKTGGKRIRPYVTLLTYQAYAPNGDISSVLPAAAAEELLHLAMLIHDDVIDRDQTRYGVANVSGQYEDHYAKIADTAQRRHFADSAALLAGDLLLSDAYDLLARCPVDPALILSGQRILNDAVFTVVGGELLDTETAFTDRSLVHPLEIARYKTASYSFISPLTMGATFAGADDTEITALTRLGDAIGIAYQLRDDTLGIFGMSELTGKSVTSDLQEGKYTYLTQLFYGHADAAKKAAYEAVAGRADLTDDEAESVRTLLIDSGARDALEAYIEELCETAEAHIDQLTVPTEHKSALHELLEACVKRDK